jgi:hypothetical protein
MHFLALNEPELYVSGAINQVTQNAKTVTKEIKRNGRTEKIEVPFVTKGDKVETVYGLATICSVIWYRGNCKLNKLLDESLESWAQAEGFSGFYDADEYFSEKYGSNWLDQDMMAVRFRIEGVSYD